MLSLISQILMATTEKSINQPWGQYKKLVHTLSGILCGHKKMALYVLISKIFKIHCKMRRKKKTQQQPQGAEYNRLLFWGKSN